TLAENVQEAPRLGASAVPNDHEVAVRIRRGGGRRLVAGGVGVDLEFQPLRYSGGVEAPAEDAQIVTILAVALPDHYEVPVGIGSDGGGALEARGVGIHA